jgi:hypothetical protein
MAFFGDWAFQSSEWKNAFGQLMVLSWMKLMNGSVFILFTVVDFLYIEIRCSSTPTAQKRNLNTNVHIEISEFITFVLINLQVLLRVLSLELHEHLVCSFPEHHTHHERLHSF